MIGCCIGIVVQNNDPQKRGRLKIFIPHLSLNLLEGWDGLDGDKNKSFVDLSDPTISSILEKIKDRLPWANCATPIVGEAGNQYYNSQTKKTSYNDGVKQTGDKPAKAVEANPPKDGFGVNYNHNSYNNTGKGLFSIPKVGTKVWVFFENGNTNRPVYFASVTDTNDWVGVADENYPNEYENITSDATPTGEEYKNKMVVSQRGGVIEIINTDNKESLQISHFGGSFKIWTNSGNKEYVKGNDNKLVSGYSTHHVSGNNNELVNGSSTIHVNGNFIIKSDSNIKIEAPNIELKGNILLNGPLVQGTESGHAATMRGPLTVDNDVMGAGVSLENHTHGGVDRGPSNTDPPN